MKSQIKVTVLIYIILLVVLNSIKVFANIYPGIMFSEYSKKSNLKVDIVGHFDSSSGSGGTEIVDYAPKSKKIFVINGTEQSVNIIGTANMKKKGLTKLSTEKKILLKDLSCIEATSGITSVSVSPDEKFIAISVTANPITDNGTVILFGIDGEYITKYEVGALPDMLKISNNSKYILVANEGEPDEDYLVDPEGSVSIIDLKCGLTKGKVTTVKFDNNKIIEKTVRKSNPAVTYSKNLEPEFITIDDTNNKAYIVCQESNAIAVLNLKNKSFEKVCDLGTKDFSLKKNKFDLSSKDGIINLDNYPVLSFYQPNGIDLVRIKGKSYIFTANEGDTQEYTGYSEVCKVNEIKDNIKLDASYYKGYTQKKLDKLVKKGLFNDEKLGDLYVTKAQGKNSKGIYTALYGFGGRSFSIFEADTLKQVYDSGNDFEKITSKFRPDYFNASKDGNLFDICSSDKGVEPEGIVVGMISTKYYAFIGLEEFGGVMIYDVTNVNKPKFKNYITTRQFGEEMGGDIAPEGLKFVNKNESPTGYPLLLVANEGSGTMIIYQIKQY